MYDPEMVQPFRDELTSIGVQELLTPDAVDSAMKESGTTLVFVNSVCGCAAGSARPGLRMSMMNDVKPDRVVTVFAGMEHDATARPRCAKPYQPSSPQIALAKDGQLVHMIQRTTHRGSAGRRGRAELSDAYTKHCG